MNLTGLNAGLIEAARYAVTVGQAYGLSPEVTSVYRDIREQQQLRARYENCLRTYGRVGTELPAGCRYPANRPGDSAHNWGLAWDSWVPAAQMPLWVQIREALGWTVPEADQVHAELPNWRSYVRRAG